MKKHITFVITIAFFLGMACSACEGPTGDQGEQGPQGEEGPQGPKGDTGTANVIYSEWMDIDWNLIDAGTTKSMRIEEQNLTEEFRGSGVVLVYTMNTVDSIFQLPLVSSNADWKFYHWFRGEFLTFELESLDGSPVPEEIGGWQIRYVLIPGGVPAKMGKNFLKNYQAVKKYYEIPD